MTIQSHTQETTVSNLSADSPDITFIVPRLSCLFPGIIAVLDFMASVASAANGTFFTSVNPVAGHLSSAVWSDVH